MCSWEITKKLYIMKKIIFGFMSLAIIMGMMSCKESKNTEELQVKINRVEGSTAYIQCTYNQSVSDGYAIMLSINEQMTDEMRAQLVEHYNSGKASHQSRDLEATELISGKTYHVYCVTFKKADGNVTFGEAKELTFITEPENASLAVTYDHDKSVVTVEAPQDELASAIIGSVKFTAPDGNSYYIKAKVESTGFVEMRNEESDVFDEASQTFICNGFSYTSPSTEYYGYRPIRESLYLKFKITVYAKRAANIY